MSRTLIGIGLGALLLLSLLVLAPARLLGLVVPADQVLLQGFAGTLWQGSASRCLLQVPGGYLHLGRLEWRLSPLSLLTLSPRLQLDSRWGGQQLSGQVILRSSRDFDLADFDGVISAALLRELLPVELVGSLSLQLEQLAIRDGLPVSGSGRLVWQHAGWVAGQAERSLGHYAVDITPLAEPGRGLAGQVITLSGGVSAQGQVELAGNQYLIDILLAGSGLEDPQLRQALQLVATPQGQDYRLLMNGEI